MTASPPSLVGLAVAMLLAVALLPEVALSSPALPDAAPLAARGVEGASVEAEVVPGEVLVHFDEDVEDSERRRVLAQHGAVPTAELPASDLTVADVPVGFEAPVARALTADPAVAYADPNIRRRAFAPSPAAATGAGGAGGPTTQRIPWGVSAVRAPQAWGTPRGPTGAGIRVAVLDSGVDGEHPDLAGAVVGWRDFVAGSAKPIDPAGHGTAVAGLVAARDNSEGLVGVAPRARLLGVRVLDAEGFGSDAHIIQGLGWAVSAGADVINLSLGEAFYSQALAEAVAAAVAHGVVVVAASGNAGDGVPNYPAALPGVISVGALGTDRRPASFSSYGKVDLAAPGARLPVLLPRRVGSYDLSGASGYGTSFAAPLVAGAVALAKQQLPQLRGRFLRQMVVGTAVDPLSGRIDPVDFFTGHGLPDAERMVTWDPTHPLLSFDAARRVAGNGGNAAGASTVAVAALVTDGAGAPQRATAAVWRASPGSRLRRARAATSAAGLATVRFASTAAGRQGSLRISAAGLTRSLHVAVTEADDDIPGVPARTTNVSGRLSGRTDSDDVWRVHLRRGETLRLRGSASGPGRQLTSLFVYGPTARQVLAARPVAHDLDSPFTVSVPAARAGWRYVDTYYQDLFFFPGAPASPARWSLSWSINAPRKVSGARATPSVFTPDHDGRRDRTTIGWEVSQRGRVALRIRDSAGKTVRAVDFGVRRPGPMALRWAGRNNRGQAVPAGVYRIAIDWRDGRGRVSSTSASVRLRR